MGQRRIHSLLCKGRRKWPGLVCDWYLEADEQRCPLRCKDEEARKWREQFFSTNCLMLNEGTDCTNITALITKGIYLRTHMREIYNLNWGWERTTAMIRQRMHNREQQQHR